MIIQQITFSEFSQKFHNMGRADNFTYTGLQALYEYLNDLSESIGEPIELDVIAICCDYIEYEDFKEFQNDYSQLEIETIEDINNHTTLIKTNDQDSFIIQQF